MLAPQNAQGKPLNHTAAAAAFEFAAAQQQSGGGELVLQANGKAAAPADVETAVLAFLSRL